MKTIIIAIVFFFLGFLFGGGFGANIALNFGFDSFAQQLKNGIDVDLSGKKIDLNGTSINIQQTLNQKKDEFIDNLNTQKDQILQKVQEDIKTRIREWFSNLF